MWLSIQLLLLITAANGAPLLLKKLLGPLFDYPLDFNRPFFDGYPLFGKAKTYRGIAAALIVTPILSTVLGLTPMLGFTIALAAMFGDLCSSFIKRRLRLQASDKMTGLDQIPESLFPLLACKSSMGLSWSHLLLMEIVFVIGAILLSKLLFSWHLRDKPY